MNITARYRRTLTAISLVLTAVLTVLWGALQPSFADPSEQLAVLDAAGAPATIAQLSFVLAQLPLIIAMLGVAHLFSVKAPILSNITATIGILGAFGHAVSTGSYLIVLTMADDTANHDAHLALMAKFDEEPVLIPFLLMGLVGLVLGTIFLAIGLWRSRTGPRWVPLVLVAFLLVEFFGHGLTAWAGQVAALLYLTAFLTLAVVVWKSPLAVWAPASQTATGSEPPDVEVADQLKRRPNQQFNTAE